MKVRKRKFTFYILVALLLFTIFIFMYGQNLSDELILKQKIVELYEKVKHAEMLNLVRRSDVAHLKKHFSMLLKAINQIGFFNNSILSNGSSFRPYSQSLLADIQSGVELQLPSIHHFLPHLLSSPDSLMPSIKVSRNRSGVSMVLGIPTVKREMESYLLPTLQNLIGNMSPEERNDTIVIVFIAETDTEYVNILITDIVNQFHDHLNNGLLEIITPPAAYYPDFNTLKPNLGDPFERVKWRTKQNLDFSFLMMYAQPKGTFYIQLEDDILSKPKYIETMKKFAYKQMAEKKEWMILDFCQLGFIGKMFKCVDLSKFINFFLIFHADKPVDWLLDHVLQTKVCRFDENAKSCRKRKDDVWLHYKPSLFQHVGAHSSLKGKVQKLKDKQFGKLLLYHPHKNPEAVVKTTLKAYERYTIERAYKGKTFFWCIFPQYDDIVAFHFKNVLRIQKYLFRSGNAEHPEDKFYNTTVEVLPVSYNFNHSYSKTKDGYLVLGQFEGSTGVAEGNITADIGPIEVLRLHVLSESGRWAILNEILIEPLNTTVEYL